MVTTFKKHFTDISNGIEKYPLILRSTSVSAEQQDVDDANFQLEVQPLKDLFQYIKTNIPSPEFDKELFSESYQGCSCVSTCDVKTCSCLYYFGCSYDHDGRLQESSTHGGDDHKAFQSKPILECGNECTCCKERCSNRVVQKGTATSFCVFPSDEKGYGLKTLEPLQRRRFVCEYAGEVVCPDEARKRLLHSDQSGESNYLIALREHSTDSVLCTYVDPKRYGNLGRFINHSCDPNLVMLPVRVNHGVPRLALFARRDLKAGEELTFDYSGNATFSIHPDQPDAPQLSLQQNQSNQSAYDTYYKSHSSSCSSHQNQSTLYANKTKAQFQIFPNGTHSAESIEKSETQAETYDGPSVNKRQKFDETVSTLGAKPHVQTQTSLKDLEKADDITQIITESASFPYREKTNRPCRCGSHNCAKFLPFDASLLHIQ